jgi:hypothetical protein
MLRWQVSSSTRNLFDQYVLTIARSVPVRKVIKEDIIPQECHHVRNLLRRFNKLIIS